MVHGICELEHTFFAAGSNRGTFVDPNQQKRPEACAFASARIRGAQQDSGRPVLGFLSGASFLFLLPRRLLTAPWASISRFELVESEGCTEGRRESCVQPSDALEERLTFGHVSGRFQASRRQTENTRRIRFFAINAGVILML